VKDHPSNLPLLEDNQFCPKCNQSVDSKEELLQHWNLRHPGEHTNAGGPLKPNFFTCAIVDE